MGKHENNSDDLGVGSIAVTDPAEAPNSRSDIETKLAHVATTAARTTYDGAVYAVGESGGMYRIRTKPIPGTNLRWAHIDK
jgi:hypothetical protein